MKRIHFLAYECPGTIKILISPYIYVYRSSEVICRRFMNSINYGLGFRAFRKFKGQAELVRREKIVSFIDESGEVR